MATKDDKNVGIIIDLLVDTEQFLMGVQKSMESSKNLIKQRAKDMQRLLNEVFNIKGVDQNLIRQFSALTNVIERSVKSFADVKRSGKDLSSGLLDIKNSSAEVQAAWIRIAETRKQLHSSYAEAAKTLTRLGEIEASVAQQALRDNNQKLMSNKQLESSYSGLVKTLQTFSGNLKNAFNIDDQFQKLLRQMAELRANIETNRAQLTALTSGKGFQANVKSIATDPGAAAKIQARATAFGETPTSAGLSLLRNQELTVNQVISGLRAIGKNTDLLIPTYKQLENAVNRQKQAYDGFNSSINKHVGELRKVQAAEEAQAEARKKAADRLAKSQRDSAENERRANETKANRLQEKQTILGIEQAEAKLLKTKTGLNAALEKQRALFANNQKQLEALKNSTLGWATASVRAGTDISKEMIRTGVIIQDLAKKFGVNLTKAAQLAVSGGMVELGNAQSYLAGQNEKFILSETQATAALNVQEQQIRKNQVATNNLSKNIGKLAEEEKKLTGQAKPMPFFQNLGRFTDGITKMAGQFLLFQYILQQVVQAMSEINRKFLEFDKSVFTLEAVIKSARSQIGFAAGSMKSWSNVIKELQVQFPQFSEKSVTGATANIVKLTSVMGLNEAQIRSVLVQAATLSQVTGTDLVEATDDLMRALGGSSVVLDKYGIFIRDADKNNTEFAKSLGKTTDQMNSQELAIATLQAIMKQTLPLTESLGEYSLTASGRIAQSNARIENSLTQLGKITIELDIFFKSLYADFLEGIQKVLPLFDDLLATIRKTNVEVDIRTGVTKSRNAEFGGETFFDRFARGRAEPAVDPNDEAQMKAIGQFFNLPVGKLFRFEYGQENLEDFKKQLELVDKQDQVLAKLIEEHGKLNEKLNEFGNGTEEEYARLKELDDKINARISETNISRDVTTFDIAAGFYVKTLYPDLTGPELEKAKKEFIDAYVKELEIRNKLILDEERRRLSAAYQETEIRPGQLLFRPDEQAPVDEEAQKKALEIIEDYRQRIVDAVIDRNRDIQDAEIKHGDDMEDIIIDRQRDLAELQIKLEQDEAKEYRNRLDSEEDAYIRFQRDLRDLEQKEAEKKKELDEDNQDKSIEAWRDYYRELERLNQQYLFDLRDAVAENDAVSVKRLERKYNLDKLKIDQRLQDRLEDENKNRKKSLDELSKETEDRRKELEQRYKDELEDIKRNYERQLRELQIKNDEEEAEIKLSFENRRSDLQRDNEREIRDINNHFDQRLEDIGRKLRLEEELQDDHYKSLFQNMEEYLGKDGKFLNLINGFYDEELRIRTNREYDYSIYDPQFQKWLKDTYGITVPNNWRPGSSGGGSGPRPNPNYQIPQSFVPDQGLERENATVEVTFSSDGSIPDEFYDIVSERTINEIAGAIRNITMRAV